MNERIVYFPKFFAQQLFLEIFWGGRGGEGVPVGVTASSRPLHNVAEQPKTSFT